MILISIVISLLIVGVTAGGLYIKNSTVKKNNTNNTIENISTNKTLENNETTNDSANNGAAAGTKKSSGKSSSSNSYYGEGSSAVDSNGNIKSPPDGSTNWVINNGKWQRAVSYKNGHYVDYHGDIVDHKMKNR